MTTQSTPVLIVGGGLAGLSAALFLAWRGVDAVLVERRPGSSPHPRAVGFTTRTLELFRAVGIIDDIPQAPMGHGRPRRVTVESLTGHWSEEVRWSPGKSHAPRPGDPPAPRIGHSPVGGAAIAQDRLEPLIRAHAVRLGADVRLATTLMSFTQDADAVTAVLRDSSGRETTVRADYMIAADGHASRIRDALAIGRRGHGPMHVVRSIMFRAPAIDHYLDAGISQFELDQPDLKGMLTTYRDGRWLLMITDDQERDEAAQRVMVNKAIGRCDLDVELITSGRWVLSALIADTFTSGRVFIAGDAAHTLPPARGGYGANTGIEDAFNIAWKLASVCNGHSKPALLETYDPERRAIAWLRHNQIFARQDYAPVATDEEKKVAVIEDDAMELGQLYRSTAVLDAGDDLPPALRPEQWAGQPGTRAQHLWVLKGDARVSTIDLLQRDWTLLTEDARWCVAVDQARAQLAISLECLHFGGDAQSPGTPIAPTPPGVTQLTVETPIEQIVAEPAGKAVLDAHVPKLTPHDRYQTFKSMTLRQLQPMSQGMITDAALALIAVALEGVVCTVTPGDCDVFLNDFEAAFGIGPSGASLIRPDGYVAWRSKTMPADPDRALIDALRRVASSTR